MKKILSLSLSTLLITTACLTAAPQISEAAPHRGPVIHHQIPRPPRPHVGPWGPPPPPRGGHVRPWGPPPPPPPRRISRTDRAVAAAAIIAAILSNGR